MSAEMIDMHGHFILKGMVTGSSALNRVIPPPKL